MNRIYGLLLSLILLTGCVSTETKETINRQATRLDNMVSKIENGQTTRENEQAFIKAERVLFHTMNYDVNDVALPPDVALLLNLLCED